MTLSTDRGPEVRNWVTFGLARQTDRDFPQLRDALAARLGDDDPDTLAEAIHGLAVRADARAIRPLLRALEASPDRGDIDFINTEALYALAIATADPRLYPHLLAHRDGWISDAPNEDLPPLLQSAGPIRYDARTVTQSPRHVQTQTHSGHRDQRTAAIADTVSRR